MVSLPAALRCCAGARLSWVGAGRILGDVGVADQYDVSRAYRAESAVGDFGAVFHHVSDRRAAGRFWAVLLAGVMSLTPLR